jgi:lysozyme
MEYSQNGLKLTEQFEGCKLKAYKDSAGVWTIGYGHTRGVGEGLTCTLQQAESWLMEDIGFAEAAVNDLVIGPLLCRQILYEFSQEEFDALVDFVFNVGIVAFKNSTMLRLLLIPDFPGAAAEFAKWDKSGGQVVAGLLARREAEARLFTEETNGESFA